MYPAHFGRDLIRGFLLAGAIIDIAFLPTLIAAFKRRADLLHILLINLLTSWTIIGWVVAMIMAVADDDRPAAREMAYRDTPGPVGPPASAHPATQWLYQQQAAAAPPPPAPYDYPGYDS